MAQFIYILGHWIQHFQKKLSNLITYSWKSFIITSDDLAKGYMKAKEGE